MHAVLTITAGEGRGRRVVIRPGQAFLVGRGRNVTIPLRDGEVSRRHATIELRSDGLYVTDLGSRNGTWVGGGRLRSEAPTRVEPGAGIALGAHLLGVELVGFEPEALERTRDERVQDSRLFPHDEFEFLDEIGQGATGRIWAARQVALDRRVAIKVLRPVGAHNDHTVQERFLREGRLCQRVRSPYVVEVHDVRVLDGVPVIVMELVQGPSLADRLQEGPLPLPDALRVGEDIARALVAVSQAHVVHRDVKPANILLSPAGLAKLGDFGLAKQMGLSTLTGAGTGMGSLPYAAPEQVEDGSTADWRSDVYGLGATLYHALAGRPPFHRAQSSLEAIRMIFRDEPEPLADARPDCPPELVTLVHHMMAKDPRARPHAAADVVGRLCSLRVRLFPPDIGADSEATLEGMEPPALPA